MSEIVNDIQPQLEQISVLKVRTNKTELIEKELPKIIKNQSKKNHPNAPVVIEIEDKHFQANDLAVVVELLTQNNLVAIGLRSSKQELLDFAQFSGLAIFKDSPQASKIVEEKKVKTSISPSVSINKVTTYSEVVEKNKQIYSDNGDLAILNQVEKNAELIALNSVSVFGKCSGKIYAGIKGNKSSLVYVKQFNAQLISIAGVYKIFDKVPEKFINQEVYIDLYRGKLRFRKT